MPHAERFDPTAGADGLVADGCACHLLSFAVRGLNFNVWFPSLQVLCFA